MPRILYRYILKEIAGPWALALGAVTMVGVMSQIIRFLDKVFSYDLGLATLGYLLLCATLPLLSFTLPASLLLAILLGTSRLSSDSEMIALRAAGVSLWQLLPPIIGLALIASIATGVVTTLAGSGSGTASTDGTGTAADFQSTRGITIVGTILYVTERNGHVVRKVVISTGVVTTLAGSGNGPAAPLHPSPRCAELRG